MHDNFGQNRDMIIRMPILFSVKCPGIRSGTPLKGEVSSQNLTKFAEFVGDSERENVRSGRVLDIFKPADPWDRSSIFCVESNTV